VRRHLRVVGDTKVELSPAGQHFATGLAALASSLFFRSPRLKSALVDTAVRCFSKSAEELRRDRERRAALPLGGTP
jgi:hypothetical protein